MSWRDRFPSLAPWFLSLLALVGFAAATGHPFHDSYCALVVPAVDPSPQRIRLLGCSNIEQHLLSENAADGASDAPGWQVLTPQPDQERTHIFVKLRNYPGHVIFYPRLSGADSSVTVNEQLGPFSKKLFSLTGRDACWGQIGAQYPLCLDCVENGWSNEEFPITLEIVLKGRGSQLWHKGDIVFFETP